MSVIKGWQKDRESVYVCTGILLSSFIGFVVGLFVGLGSHDLWTGVYAFAGATMLCMYLTFWRCNG